MSNRREFITLLGGATMAWPLAARAQQPAMPAIGFLSSGSADTYAHFLSAFLQTLNEAGYFEGRNVAIEYRWAEGQYDRLPAMAAELARRQVAVIVASGGLTSALAAKTATSTIPIVFSSVDDPVKAGLAISLNRPGRNATGMSLFTGVLAAKQLELLRELVPNAAAVAVLVNPDNANTESHLHEMQEAARLLGLKLHVLNARSERDFDPAFATIVQQRIGVLVVGADALFNSRRDQVVALAARSAVPTIYQFREFPAGGGLISYGANVADGYRQVGVYTGRILKGDKVGDLPVVQPTKFDFVINLTTAKALGLTIPESFLLRADELIE
jgi:putative tryptophan/tyrosine transport system substrate-binding protein